MALPPGATRTLAGSSRTLVASPPSAAVERDRRRRVAAALQLDVEARGAAAAALLRPGAHRDVVEREDHERRLRARATTSPRERETASIVSGHSRASASGERGGASTTSKRCSWSSPEPNGSR